MHLVHVVGIEYVDVALLHREIEPAPLAEALYVALGRLAPRAERDSHVPSAGPHLRRAQTQGTGWVNREGRFGRPAEWGGR